MKKGFHLTEEEDAALGRAVAELDDCESMSDTANVIAVAVHEVGEAGRARNARLEQLAAEWERDAAQRDERGAFLDAAIAQRLRECAAELRERAKERT